MEDEINLIAIIRVIFKYKTLIIWVFIMSILAALVFTLITPKMYKASATILPLDTSSSNSWTSFLGALSGGGESGPTRLVAIFKSKTLAKEVINDLDLLKDIYQNKWDQTRLAWKGNFIPSLDTAASALSKNIDIKTTKEEVLEISVVWNDPEIAAKIANKYVNKLSDFINNRSLGVTFQSVDPAVPPDRAFKPKLKQNLLLAGIASLFAGVLLAFAIDYVKNLPPIKL